MHSNHTLPLSRTLATFAALAAASRLWAGTFTTDFNSGLPGGAAVFGSALVDTSGGYTNSGCLKLTSAASESGSFIVTNDLDSGSSVVSFIAQFKLLVGGGTGADGFSFNFAPDLPQAGFGEDGAGTGLTITFDTYDNDGAGSADYAGIGLKEYGVEIATYPFTGLRVGTFVDVVVQLHPNGTVDVIYDGTSVFANYPAFFTPLADSRFGLGARTGSLFDNHFVDNLSITTWTSAAAYVDSFRPVGRSVRGDAPVQIVLTDYSTAVDTNTIVLKLDGATVSPTITQAAPNTTLTYQSPGLFASGSAHAVQLTFADNASPTPATTTLDYGFTVAAYTTLPTNLVAAPSLVSSDPGFALRVSQIEANLGQTIERAEKQLANLLIDPNTGLPYSNHATVTAANEAGVINYSTQGAQGNFPTEGANSIPGLPGMFPDTSSSGDTNAALDAVTYLYLDPGVYTLGVNSSDGFRLTVASTPDLFATQVALFDGVRAAADTTASFGIAQAGYYPFRICYLVGGLEAVNPTADNPSLEFFSTDALGNRILINDTSTAGSLAAYRPAQTLPYIRSVSPIPGSTGVPNRTSVGATLVDGSITVQTNTIELQFNGVGAPAGITRASGVTTVQYQPASLPLNSSNFVQLAFTDSAGTRRTNAWYFIVENILSQLWVIPPASATNATWAKWVTTGSTERGLAYNPKTGHVLLVSRSAATGTDGPAGGGVGVFDGNTGQFIKKLDLGSGVVAGGTFAVNMVDVADDGVIYVCNLATSAAQNFRVYRWANEDATPTIAFSAPPSAAAGNPRWGDSFVVRGSGATTAFIASGNNVSANSVPLFTTADGTNFNVTVTVPTGLPNNAVRLGLAFGCGNSFYGQTIGTGNPLRYVAFNGPPSTVASLTASYTILDYGTNATIGPIGVDLGNQRLIGDATSQVTGSSHSMNLYDLNVLATTGTNLPIDHKNFATSTGSFGTGAVDFTPDGTRVYTLDTGNGVIAFSLSPKLAAPSICGQPQTMYVAGPGSVGGFRVDVIGAPLSYQWYFGNSPLAGQTNRTLDIPDVQVANLGNYKVVVTNSMGVATSANAVLDTLMVITNQPASQTVAVGGTASFTIGVSNGLPAYSYQWKLNGADVANGTAASLTVASAQIANAGGYTVVITDSLGQSVTSAVAALTVGTPGTGTGLTGEYLSGQIKTFIPPATLTRVDPTVDFDWGLDSPDAIVTADSFTVRWSGQVQPFYSQTYTFTTRTDDGVRLWVNGQILIDKWVDQAPTDWTGTIALTAGQKCDVVMEYYENGGGAVAQLSWSSTGQAKGIIPMSQLYPAPAPFQPALQTSLSGGNVVVTWPGTFNLLTTTNLVGAPWEPVPGATSPYTVPTGTDPERYYRLQSQ